MDILIIYNSGLLSDGSDCLVEKQIGYFASELKGLGHKITFFGQKINSQENDGQIFPILKNEMYLIALKRRRNKLLNYLLLYLLSIYAVVKSDFIYIFYPNAFKYVAILSILLKRKYGIYIRGMENLDDWVSIFIYKRAETVLTVSPYFSELVNSLASKSVANSIRPMIPFTEKDIVSNRHYEKKEKYIFLYMGRIANDKGLDELLHAMSQLKNLNIKCHLNIVGLGDYTECIRELISRLDIEDMTSIVGGIFDQLGIQSYYEESDIFVLPSYHEGFPRTIYEAMIFGLPIVTTSVGGISAIMKDRYNCRIVGVHSVKDLVEVLSDLTSNYTQVKELADNARLTVKPIIKSNRPTHAQQLNLVLARYR